MGPYFIPLLPQTFLRRWLAVYDPIKDLRRQSLDAIMPDDLYAPVPMFDPGSLAFHFQLRVKAL